MQYIELHIVKILDSKMNTRSMRKQQSTSNYSVQNSNNVNLNIVLRPLKNINYAEEDGNFDDIKDLDYYPELDEDEDDSDDDDDDYYVDENEDEFNYSFLKNKMTKTNEYSEDILDGGIINQETDSDTDSDYIPSDIESDDDDYDII